MEFYKFIMNWKQRRLLWLLKTLPVDLIRYIDDLVIESPLYDLIEIMSSIESTYSGPEYACPLTLISESHFRIPKSLFKDSRFLSDNVYYLFVIDGHIKLDAKQVYILNKYGLKYKYVYNYPRGN